jgi:uncharacterized protein
MKISSIPYELYWENNPLNFSYENNTLVLTADAQTDLFSAPGKTSMTNNAPQLLFKADVDFVLTAAIEHSFTSKWDAGALVVKTDKDNWVKFCFEKDYTGANRVVSVVTRGISDDCNSVEVKSNKIYYKAAKSGNVVLLYFSEDGDKWFLIRNLFMDAANGISAGFLAQSPIGEKCTVTFTDIQYEARTITDPYNPEK